MRAYNADKLDELLNGMIEEMTRSGKKDEWHRGVVDAVKHIQNELTRYE